LSVGIYLLQNKQNINTKLISICSELYVYKQ